MYKVEQESCRIREKTRKRGVVQTTIWSLLSGQTDTRVATSRRTRRRLGLLACYLDRLEIEIEIEIDVNIDIDLYACTSPGRRQIRSYGETNGAVGMFLFWIDEFVRC